MSQKTEVVLGKTYVLHVRLVDKRNKPVKSVNVKVFNLVKEAISPEQWAENLKNGAPFKKLILSTNTNDNGVVTAELPEGTYESKIEQYGLSNICELTKNVEVLFTEPKQVHWWQRP